MPVVSVLEQLFDYLSFTQLSRWHPASLVVGLAAWQAHRPDLIRSPKRVLAHLWEDSEL